MKHLKITFCGTHSTGKTTLVKELKKAIDAKGLYRVDVDTVETVARTCPLPINKGTSPAAQNWIILKRCLVEIEKLNTGDTARNSKVLLSARSVLDDFAYLLATNSRSPSVPFERGIVDYWMKSYDYIFYLPPEIDIVPDGVRDTDANFRLCVDNIIREELEIRKINYTTITGSVAKRTADVMRILKYDLEKMSKERADEKEQIINKLASMKSEV